MTIQLTLEKAITLIKGCIAERGGDYVYSNPDCPPDGACSNWHTTADCPGCIIGLAMYRWFEEIGQADWAREQLRLGSVIGVTSSALLDALGVNASQMTLSFLAEVQRQQDDKVSWRGALSSGLQYIGICS